MSDISTAVSKALGTNNTVAGLCTRQECAGIAEWQVGAQVWAQGAVQLPYNCVEIKFPLFICDECKRVTTIDEIVDARGWRQIRRAVRSQGRATPDRNSLKIVFSPLLMGSA